MRGIRNDIHINVVSKRQKTSKKQSKCKKPPSPNKGNGAEHPTELGLPEIYPVSKSHWDQHEFDKYSGLRVVNNGDNRFDYYYNCDNAYLRHEQKAAKDDQSQLLDVQFKTALVLLGMSIMADGTLSEDDKPKLAAKMSRTLAPVLLPMINGLGRIE